MGRRWSPGRGGLGTRLRLALGTFVFLGALAGLLLASRAEDRVEDGVRALILAHARWSRSCETALVYLERYALTGDPASLARYQEAMAFPRAVRPVLRAALDHPGDVEAIRAAMARGSAEFTRENVRGILRLPAAVGSDHGSRATLGLWGEADGDLAALEGVADSLAAVVASSGPASAAARPYLDRVALLHDRLQADAALFDPALGAWLDGVAARLRAGVALAAALLGALGLFALFLLVRSGARAERALRESEARFRQLAEGIGEVFWLTDPDHSRVHYVSPAYEDVWGRSRDALYADPSEWLGAIHPDDRPGIEAAAARQGFRSYDEEYRIVRPDGRVRWIRDRAFPVLDQRGRLVRVAGIAEDVTRLKEREHDLVQARAFRSLGRLAAVVAHEFNNLMTVVQNNAQLAILEGVGSEAEEELEAVMAAADRAAALTRALLSASGRQLLAPRAVDVETLVREVVAERPPGVGAVAVRIEDDLPPAWVDPLHLADALEALVVRAADASRGPAHIRAEWLVAKEPVPVQGKRLAPGGYVRLVVEGPAPAVAPEALERFFDPMAVAETGDGGATLAMPAAYGIVDQSGGGIRVEPGPDGGCRFTLLLPVVGTDALMGGGTAAAAGVAGPA